MEIKDIIYVKAVCEHKTLTKAAESLYISQPSLSLYLKNMQERLGFEIFNQVGKRFELTYMGEAFLEAGKEILRVREDFYDRAAHIQNNKVGRLRVALPVLRGSYLAPAILPKFQEIYPNVEIELIEDSSEVIEEKVGKGEADLALMNRPHHPLDLEVELIRTEQILLAVPSGHAVNHQRVPSEKGMIEGEIDLHVFQDDRFIIHHSDQRTGQISLSIFNRYNFTPSKVLYTRNIETALNLSASGFGISFVNETHIRHLNFVEPPRYYSLSHKFFAELIVVYRKGRKLPPYGLTFIDLCRKIM